MNKLDYDLCVNLLGRMASAFNTLYGAMDCIDLRGLELITTALDNNSTKLDRKNADLISREDAFKIYCEGCEDKFYCYEGNRYCVEGQELDELPSAQPEKVCKTTHYSDRQVYRIMNVSRKELK